MIEIDISPKRDEWPMNRKRRSTSSVIRETQRKAVARRRLTSARMATKGQLTGSVMWGNENHHTCWQEWKMVQPLWKRVQQSPKSQHRATI